MYYAILIVIHFLLELNNGNEYDYTEMEASSNACYSSTSSTCSGGENTFSAPKSGIIRGIKLNYISGFVNHAEGGGGNRNKWGRSGTGAPEALLIYMIKVIDDVTISGKQYYPIEGLTQNTSGFHTYQCGGNENNKSSYYMTPYDPYSIDLKFINPPYYVTTNDTFSLQYGECSNSISDNLGTVLMSVYFLYDKTCEERGLIHHINWDKLIINNNNLTNIPYSDINIDLDLNTLTTTIDIKLEYLGKSYTEYNDEIIELGTTYYIDFEPFNSESSINKPGNCQNRIEISFQNVNKNNWWFYDNEWPYWNNWENSLGSNEYLAYPPTSSYWILSSINNNYYDDTCSNIQYHGVFKWEELINCVNYNGDKLIDIIEDNEKITLLWTIYVSVLSPFNNNNDNEFYRQYQLIQQDFSLELIKTVNTISSTETQDLFTIIVYNVRLDKNGDDDNVFEIEIFTESSDFIILSDPITISTPLTGSTTYSVYLLNDNNNTCIISSDYTCGQMWKLEIINVDDTQCPNDLSGIYTIQFRVNCDNNTDLCQTFLLNNGNSSIVILSTYLYYIDNSCSYEAINNIVIHGDIQFYSDYQFSKQQTIYGIGYPIYTELSVEIINGSGIKLFDILEINITNVWVCTADDNVQVQSCLLSNIDTDGPYNIISSGIPDYINYNAQNIDSNKYNTDRFVFNIFDTKRNTIYIHIQSILTVQSSANNRRRRRRQLLNVNINVTNKIKHFIADVSIYNTTSLTTTTTNFYKTTTIIEKVDKTNNNNNNYFMLILMLIVVILIIIIIAIIIGFKWKANKLNKKIKIQINQKTKQNYIKEPTHIQSVIDTKCFVE